MTSPDYLGQELIGLVIYVLLEKIGHSFYLKEEKFDKFSIESNVLVRFIDIKVIQYVLEDIYFILLMRINYLIK